jgi:hypothetical protein
LICEEVCVGKQRVGEGIERKTLKRVRKLVLRVLGPRMASLGYECIGLYLIGTFFVVSLSKSASNTSLGLVARYRLIRL